MTKLRKQRRRKTYKYNVNRKRLRNKIYSVGNIECKEIKQAWDRSKSVKTNLEQMGLSYDPNQTLKIPKMKAEFKASMSSNENDWLEEETQEESAQSVKGYVAEELEKDAKAPRVKLFRLPNGQVELITYLMDKYGSDYKAMARDKRNYYQETWKKLRAKIKRFMSIPEQYSKYLEKKSNNETTDLVINKSDVEDDDDDVF